MKPQTRKKIQTLIGNAKTVWVASVDEDGFPNVKAMFATGKNEGLRVHLMSTNTSSRRAQQFLKNPRAAIYFCAPEAIDGAMLRGTMEVRTDARLRELLWNPGDEKYYPLGVTDPDYCVLRFTATDGNCWLCGEGKTTFTMDELEGKA